MRKYSLHPKSILFGEEECHVMESAVTRHRAEMVLQFEKDHGSELVETVLGIFHLATGLNFVPEKKGYVILDIFRMLAETDLNQLTDEDALICGCTGKKHRETLRQVVAKITKKSDTA